MSIRKAAFSTWSVVLWSSMNICLLTCSCQDSSACGPGQQGGQDCLGPKYLSVPPKKTNSMSCGLTGALLLEGGQATDRMQSGAFISLCCCGNWSTFALNPTLLWSSHLHHSIIFQIHTDWSENCDPWELLIKILKPLPSALEFL